MSNKLSFPILLVAGLLLLASACSNSSRKVTNDRPKIVVGLMVDQMRWDYLYRYWDRYGDEGFKRLLREGFSYENTLIPYVPTITAVGHTTVYTGSVPAIHGVVGNGWYSRRLGKEVYCVADTAEQIVGTDAEVGRSPHKLLTTTIGDELRIATNYQSKVVGVAIKDRAAILPAGHTANGAFWWEDGKFVTSTYYMDVLPDWVKKFNSVDWTDSLMSDGWHTLYPIETYTSSTKDNVFYEEVYDGEQNPVFPHTKATITHSPFGNTLTLNFAKVAIEGYNLGEDKYTDLLAVSLSSTDKVGHQFGPNSIEVEDVYLRLDKALANFFNYLDNRFGKNGYLFFLTADHGVKQSPGYLKKHRISSAIKVKKSMEYMRDAVQQKFGSSNLILTYDNGQAYLNYQVLDQEELNKHTVASFIADHLKQVTGIANAFPSATLSDATLPKRVKMMYINGTHPTRSGDIWIMSSIGWQAGDLKGASHGDWYPYDAHIPLVWMGYGINPGQTHRTVWSTGIAPTIAAMLNIQMPSGNVGDVLTEVVE